MCESQRRDEKRGEGRKEEKEREGEEEIVTKTLYHGKQLDLPIAIKWKRALYQTKFLRLSF